MSFSQRHGYSGNAKEITIREDAPDSIRFVAIDTASRLGLSPSTMRNIVCRILHQRPNPSNWGDKYIEEEVESLVYGCEWFRVYDIIEAFDKTIEQRGYCSGFVEEDDIGGQPIERDFSKAINNCFIEEGIGWQLVKGEIVTRGDEGFQEAVKAAASQLLENERPTAASHIDSAIRALSERPKSNTSGAVSHATSSVECVLNDITGQAMTLGKYLDKHSTLFHPALKKALDGVYGYASDAGARHGKEGVAPTFDEAQFAVTTCAAACTLLTATNPKGKA